MHSSKQNDERDRLTVFMGNLHPSCVQGDFDGPKGLFVGLDVSEVRIVRDRETEEPRGHGYTVFRNQKSLDNALLLDGVVVCGQKIKLDLKRGRQQGGNQQRGSRKSEGPFIAVISNLPSGATEKDLEFMFQSLNPISTEIPISKETGEIRNVGFCEFKSKELLDQALTLDGVSWMEKTLHVTVLDPRSRHHYGGMRSQQQQHWSGGAAAAFPPPVSARFGGDANNWGRSSVREPPSDGYQRHPSTAPKPAPEPIVIDDKDRPKLVLKKADPKPNEIVASTPEVAPVTKSGKSNPFGNARPVDTASKLRSMEEAKQKAAAEKTEVSLPEASKS